MLDSAIRAGACNSFPDSAWERLLATHCVAFRNDYGNTFAEWARMNAQGLRNVRTFAAEPDIAEWLSGISLNPTRVPPGYARTAELEAARERLATYGDPGIARLEELAGG